MISRTIKRWIVSALVIISVPFAGIAQGTSVKGEPKNWYQLDKIGEGYYGISLEKAYQFVKNKKSHQVIVAVLDNGVDTLHEDLKDMLWHNPGEIAGNGIDDDHNGYVDDIYGWNFLGGKDGRNVHQDSDEGARIYYKLKAKYGNTVPDPSSVKPEERAEVEMYRKAKQKIEGDGKGIDLILFRRIYNALQKSDSVLQIAMNVKTFTGKQLGEFNAAEPKAERAKSIFYGFMKQNNTLDQTNKDFLNDFDQYLTAEERKEEAKTKAPEDFRKEIVKDDEYNINDRFYGNNDVMAGTPSHGTHTSGIIGAIRNNGKGIDGIADNVKIMVVRMVPNGDEHDKDIANAIRYAVDNGAQIINMSFGKEFSPQKIWVDDAVKYAESKDVLIVHAAGNDNADIDTTDNFPSPLYADGKGRAGNFITVGASSDPHIVQRNKDGEDVKDYIAVFSNYGKKEVDVFAPGVNIYSTMPGGNNYGNYSGTSMAGPVVAGIAAFLLEYYPNLSAKQLKYIIEKSSVPVTDKVLLPGTDQPVAMSDISKTGGEVNAYEAVKLAATIKGDRRIDQPVIKPKMIQTKKRG